LRGDVGDGELLRATFPPGSVTGAPKVQALKVIHELEATAREAYCGAIGVCSPVLGLELNVAIRTFEVAGNRLWLGAGGGIVADSAPESEVQEALDKARGVAAATGLRVRAPRHVHTSPRGRIVRGRRPDPSLGLIETIRVTDGTPDWLAAHLARLQDSCKALRTPVPVEIENAIITAAAALRSGALRVTLCDGSVRIETRPLPLDGPVQLEPVVLPGGLGAHKWADRALINSLSPGATTPLFCDLDGSVLEAGHAAAMIILGRTLIAAPRDARTLPSISRGHVLRAARRIGIDTIVEPFDVDQALHADALILTSSLRGAHVGILPGVRLCPEAQALCDELDRALVRPLRTR
jgi:para-aminobenzoate synthetase/4-amino-4-deoxychorismate lyase